MFIAVLFTIAKTWNQPICPSMIDCIKKYGTYTLWNTMQPQQKDEFMSLQGHEWNGKPSFSANTHRKRKPNTACSHS